MEPSPTPRHPETRVHNRVRAYLVHIPYYTIEGQQRLANDCGVARSTISRIVRGTQSPSYQLAEAVTRAISRRMGVPLDPREVFSADGTYPTPRVCDVTPDCTGCFPDEAYDAEGNMKPEYAAMRPGDWCTYPRPVRPGVPEEAQPGSPLPSLSLSPDRPDNQPGTQQYN
jgi:transcriptional regulator with XRE-family HTH domain